ncbi:hypothetical protein V6N11_079851 [Hibiscus sabdariffa]
MSELKDCDVQSKMEELMDPNMQADTTPSPEVLKATTCAIEAVHVSFTHAPSQENAPFVPIHHAPNQDNAAFVPVHLVLGHDNDPSIPIDHVPNQDSAQRSRKRQALPWKDKAADQEVKEFIKESLKKNAQD